MLRFQDVTFSYGAGEPPVLQGFSLKIDPGTITALLGPNGTGKTTALRLTSGWLRPSSGQVLLEERPLESYSHALTSRRIGIVPQSEATPFEFSVFECVLMGRTPHLGPLQMPGPKDFAAAGEAIERVGLSALSSRPVSTLSAGQRQLVLVARAVAQHAPLLLMDEPSAHLDMANRRRLSTIVKALAASGTTILLTTHEPDFAVAAATHLALMHEGRVLADGLFPDVFREDLLRRTFGIPLRVAQVEGRPVVLW